MKMLKLEENLSSRFYEREDEVRGLLLAALTGEHLFLLGAPGTAKSELARAFAKCLDLRHFEWLLTRFTTPEELFGPVDIRALKEGSFRRITAGKLPEAESAFLDEIWKANSAILNALLSILNERIFHNDSTVMQCPLRFAITASNEVPSDESLKALYDRLLLRYHVQPLSDSALTKLIANHTATISNPPEIDLAQFDLAQVTLPGDLGDSFIEIRRSLAKEGIVPSDRRLHRSVKLLRAHALLEGRDKVEDEDLSVLAHVLWDEPSQRNTVKKIVLRAADPGYIKALELYEACEQAAQAALQAPEDKRTEAGVEAAARIKRALSEIAKLAQGNVRIQQLENKTKALQAVVIEKCFGIKGVN